MQSANAGGGNDRPVMPGSAWAPFHHRTFAAMWGAQFVSNIGPCRFRRHPAVTER